MRGMDWARQLDFGPASAYEKLDLEPCRVEGGRLIVPAEGLEQFARKAFSAMAFSYPKGHLEKLAACLDTAEPGSGEALVISSLLRNAAIAAEGVFPMCQDTGTAMVYAWKGQAVDIDAGGVQDGGSGAEALEKGAARAYEERRLRKSQLGLLSALEERNTRDNLPAMIDIAAAEGRRYSFVFAAKGGGSSSKFSLSMESPAILEEKRLTEALRSRIGALGSSACPPYTLGVVLGGQSPSQALKVLELAVYGLFDSLPSLADADGSPIRCRDWEERLSTLSQASGAGAQWGGKALALDTRFIRLSRHAANLPLAVGVSCSAHRALRAYVDEEGWFLEKREEDPARFLEGLRSSSLGMRRIDLDTEPEAWLAELRSLDAGTIVELSGTVVAARDKAHFRFASALGSGRPLPPYLFSHPVFYAGPTEAAPGQATGSFGPTTASRMDPYLPELLEAGASLISIAKGGRGEAARRALAKAGGVYLAAVGGAAALAAQDHVEGSRILDFEDLGMEAVRAVRLKRLPVLVAIDARGKSFYS